MELLPPSQSSSPPGCRQTRSTSGGSTGGLRITVVANPQVKGPSLILCSVTSWAANGTCWALQKERTSSILVAPPNDQMSIAASEGVPELLERRIRLRCCSGGSNAWVGSGNGGYAFPGCRKGGVEKANVSWTLEVGRLVSRGSLCWVSAPCPGCLSPGSAWRAYRSRTAPFTARNQPANSSPLSVVQLGVYGGPPGGAVSCDANVYLYCLHPAGQTVPPLPGL